MAALWSDQSRFEHMLQVELAVTRSLAERGDIPPRGSTPSRPSARVDIDRIDELERRTDHDVVAFVTQVAETVGAAGRYLHYGLTSSDVVDTRPGAAVSAGCGHHPRQPRCGHRHGRGTSA